MVEKKMTLEQVKAARPALDYDGRYGSDDGAWTTADVHRGHLPRSAKAGGAAQ